jgi:hypothetical protein
MPRKVGQIIARGSKGGSSAFTWGAIAKRETAPTTIEPSTALYGTHGRI